MGMEDLLKVLKKANADGDNEVDDETIQSILFLVWKNPLPDDRGTAQAQIHEVLKTKFAKERVK